MFVKMMSNIRKLVHHMKKTIIGIAGNQLYQPNEDFFGQQLTYTPQGFIDGIHQAGGLPLVLPISDPEDAVSYIQQIDKLLLAGGYDITPQLYNEEPHPKLKATSLARDTFEIALTKEAIRQGKPIFAVCRGMQLVNIALGGTLYQDLSLYADWQVKHDMAPTYPEFGNHSIEIAENSLLSTVLQRSLQVNSYHHQIIKRLAAPLKAVAWAQDGVIEAVENTDYAGRILGVQWHPELTHKTDLHQQKLFDYFVAEL